MKRLISFLTLFTVLAGALSGSILQSACVGMIGMVAFDSPEVGFYAACTAFTLSLIMPKSKAGFAFIVFTEGICADIQESLVATMGVNAPSLKRTNVGTLEALLSPQNTAGTKQVPIDPGDGKVRQVRFSYIQRALESEFGTEKPANCSSTSEPAPKESFFTITNETWSPGIKFTEANMKKLCSGDQAYMASQINAHLDPFMRVLNKAIITDLSGNFGNFYGGSNAVKTVNLLKATGDANYPGEGDIMDDVENLESGARPIVIGAGKLRKYIRQIGIGCCNDGGVNLANAGDLDYYSDKYVGEILGDADEFICLIPGHVQLLTFNDNRGEYAKENAVFSHGTLMDPKTGITVDINWHYNDCDNFYTLNFGLKWEIWYMPSNGFQYGDELYGYNGLLNYKAAQL